MNSTDTLGEAPAATRLRGGLQPLWLLVAAYWGWLIWACAGEWLHAEDYSYGWFVPPLALYFLWKRVEKSGARWSDGVVAGGGMVGGLAWSMILVSLLVIFPLEVVRQTPIHWRPNLWLIGFLAFANTMSVAWLTDGRARCRVVLVPALFMLVGIPWPTFVESAVAWPLMQWVTGWSVGILHLMGFPATAVGTTISLPNCTVGVEEACSGLRSLQTALMVGLAAGELARLEGWGRVLLLVVAFAMAMLGNQLRVLTLAMAGIHGGNAAVADWHDAAGHLVLLVLLVGVGGACWVMRRLGRSQQRVRPEVDRGGQSVPGGSPLARTTAGWVILAAACLALLGAHGWYWVRASLAAPPQPAQLAPAGDGAFLIDEDVPEAILGVLNPDEYLYIRESLEGTPGRVIGYHFYWNPRQGNANQLYHRPDRCMPGAGWRLDGEVTKQSIRLGSRTFDFNVFPFRGPGGPALMLWGAFLNGEPVEISFNTDVYLQTANLMQFIRTGTRLYSYEVAAFIMPYEDGLRPSPAEVEAFANRVFAAPALEEGG